MRNTMRDGSVKRKPTRAAARRREALGLGFKRHDSLSPTRHPLTRNPSSYDATLAAKAAQLRLDISQPAPFTAQQRREQSPGSTFSISPARSTESSLQINMTHNARRQELRAVGHALFEDEFESIPLKPLPAVELIHVLRRTSSTLAMTQGRSGQLIRPVNRPGGMTDKVKGNFANAFSGYKAAWEKRKEHVSDEQLAIRAIVDLVKQRSGHKRILSPAPNNNFHFEQQRMAASSSRHLPSSVAWPIGDPKPMKRVPTPAPMRKYDDRLLPRPPSPPQLVFGSPRNRRISILTAHTGVTQWSDVQAAVNRASSIEPEMPDAYDFAAAASRSQGKGKDQSKSEKPLLAIQTKSPPLSASQREPTLVKQNITTSSPSKRTTALDFQAPNNIPTAPDHDFSNWNPADHTFDPDRESWFSDAGNGYRAHTTASSIYSRPARDEISIPQYPSPPPPVVPHIPEEYHRTAATQPLKSRSPVSPLSVDTSVSAFFSHPHTDGRNPYRPCEGAGAEPRDLSPVSSVSKPSPVRRQQPRGTQFYDFYRDSGIVFGGDRKGR